MSYAIIDLKKKKIFDKIEVNEICSEIRIRIPEFKEKKQCKYAKKVNKILNKYKVNNVVISTKLNELKDFKNYITQDNNYIINGTKLYKVLLPRVIEDVANLTHFDKEKFNIAILVNEYSADNIELIKLIADDVKNVILVTQNAYRFEQLVDELLRSKGIVVQLVNSKKMNLRKRHIIVNLDFGSDDLEKMNVPNESIVITNNAKIQNMKNSFNGIIIRDIDIYMEQEVKNFRSLELCEAHVYNYIKRIKENILIFNRSMYKLNGYIGNNGKIEQEDFERIGRIFQENKKKTLKKGT